MPEQRRSEIKRIFSEAADVPDDRRAAFLDDACGDDTGLRAEVAARLASDADMTASFLERVPEVPVEPIGEKPGDLIGRYQLVREIAEGGFGTVYEAQQTRPVSRQVALKVVKLGMDTRQVVTRFEAERQALAMLDHPNIARVFDAGATEQGRPFFVMEYVDGVSIDVLCDRERLTIDQRLEVFVQVCDAVQHAHQRGVIHRDLKPSNLLVDSGGERPVPKVIDFGIAKAMGPGLSEHTLVTQEGQFIGTPDYISPEQAAGDSVATTTDIYSLGVVLYQLVTGLLPFDPQTLRGKALAEIQRIIREEEPPRPSTRLSAIDHGVEKGADEGTQGSSGREIATSRRTDPRALRQRLSGDLDWITMKAMEKDPALRYSSASELAADVRRHLAHEPVLATPHSVVYKLGKFVRRNRVGVTAAAVVFFVLLAGVVGTGLALLRALDAEALAETRRVAAVKALEAAAREEESARSINAFLNHILGSVDPLQVRSYSGFSPDDQEFTPAATGSTGRDIRVVELMRFAREWIGDSFEGKPEFEAQFLETIGLTFQSAWLYDEAQDHLESALELRRETLGEDHADTLRSKLLLAFAILDARRGEYARAEVLAKSAYSGLQDLYGPNDPRTLTARHWLATALSEQRKYAEAEPHFRETLARQKAARGIGPHHRDTLMTTWDWSVSCIFQGRENKAADLAQKLHDACRDEALGPDVFMAIRDEHLMGLLCLLRGEYEDAETICRSAIEACRRELGPNHPITFVAMRFLAASYAGQMRFDVAERLYLESLEGLRSIDPRHIDTLMGMGSLSRIVYLRGDFDGAIELRDGQIKGLVEIYGEDSIWRLYGLDDMVRLLAGAGRLDDARECGVRTVAFARRVAGRPEATPFDLYWCARVLLRPELGDLRDPDQALAWARKSVEMSEKSEEGLLGERFWGERAYFLNFLARAYEATGDLDQAAATQVRRLGYLLDQDADAMELDDSARQIVKHASISPEAYERALEVAERAESMQPDDPSIVNTLGVAEYRTGRYDAALATLTRSVELNGGESPGDAAFIAMAHHQLGHEGETRTAMARLRELMEDPAKAEDPENRAFLKEAEALVTAGVAGSAN